MARTTSTLLLLALLAACSSKRVHEEPIYESGDRVAVEDGSSATADAAAGEDREAMRERREALRAAALESCAPDACEAILRGELRPGLTETAVLAATGTTEEAWRIRRSGSAVVMVPRSLSALPSDAMGDVVMVQLADGRVSRLAYQEASGVRVVDEASEATTEGRAEALAELLLREGDELAAQGALDAALDRYDRADVLSPANAMVAYRIATVLDKQLRPIEALIQYRLFLHRLELERIEARGRVAANVAEAIARAKERIVVLERRTAP